VYFWLVGSGSVGKDYGRKLAFAWYCVAKNKQYHDAADKSFATVFAEIHSNNTLDLSDPEVATDFDQYFEKSKGKFTELGDDEKSSIYDDFVATMERLSGQTIDVVRKVIRIPTSGPKDSFNFAHTELTSPCAVVRNTEVITNICIECPTKEGNP